MSTFATNFLSTDFAKNLPLIVTSLSALTVFIVKSYNFLLNNKSLQHKRFMELAKQKAFFQVNDDLEKIMADEYKQMLVNNIRGFKMTSYNNNLLDEASILKHYNSSDIKRIRGYLHFSKGKLNIIFTHVDRFMYYFHWFWAGTLLAIGFTRYVTLNHHLNNSTYYIQGGAYIATILFGLYIIYSFVAPFILAKKIKRELNLN